MPATSWSENSVAASTFYEGTPGAGTIDDGFALFGMPIPLSGALVWVTADATFTERTMSATSMTEQTLSATAWTESSG